MKHLSFISIATLVSSLLLASTVSTPCFAEEKSKGPSFDLGADLGVATRSGEPSFGAGFAAGLHLDMFVGKNVSLGLTYLETHLPITCLPDNAHDARFRALGARVLFRLSIPDSSFHPYGGIGIGWTHAVYPTLAVYNDADIASNSALLIDSSGDMIETPLSFGLQYDVTRSLVLGAEASVRPAFGFWGEAYEGDFAFGESQVGLGGTLSVGYLM